MPKFYSVVSGQFRKLKSIHTAAPNPGNVTPDNPAAPEVPVTGIRATELRRIREQPRGQSPRGAGKGRGTLLTGNCCDAINRPEVAKMDFILGLAALLSIGICCIIIAEILCRRLELDRQQPTASEREADEADAQATFQALSKEIERTARDLAKQCEGRR